MKMPKISVVIISLNAEMHMKQVLENALKITDDVVVVDSFSTDTTKEICEAFPIRIFQRKWEGYGKQKNFGNEQTKHPWILSIDADEVLSEALIEEINKLQLEEKTAYSIPFRNIYCGKAVFFGRWKNEKHVRLFPKEWVHWDENPVHEGLILKQVAIKKLKQPILHYSMHSKAEHLEKAAKYAKMGAEKWHFQGKKASFIKIYLNPIFRFVKDYFFSLGFLDGKEGLQIAYIIALERYWKYSHLKAIQEK
jgi:glycosyltransferase involved in cell wall biosynthesis